MILVDHELISLLGSALRPSPGATMPTSAQVQPASVDLRLGPAAYRMRAGILPGSTLAPQPLEKLALSTLSLEGPGALLERGLVYLVPLEERLELPPELSARFNPRSSTGRLDLFTRVLAPGHSRFDEAPPGYRGPLWLEICPLSFPVRLRRGDRLAQVRLARGRSALTAQELVEVIEHTPLVHLDGRWLGAQETRFDGDGGIELSVGLDREPAGWRAAAHTGVVEFSARGTHAPEEFFEALHAPRGRCILTPGSFYIFASRERLRIPPSLAAEMMPVDVGIGELRNNYAGFFDSGFGWNSQSGTPAVLEVRAHDVPFQIEDGQVFCRLKFFRTSSRPERLYGEGRVSYRDQGLTLARVFDQGLGSPGASPSSERIR